MAPEDRRRDGVVLSSPIEGTSIIRVKMCSAASAFDVSDREGPLLTLFRNGPSAPFWPFSPGLSNLFQFLSFSAPGAYFSSPYDSVRKTHEKSMGAGVPDS
uniref:Uncharacterized protein n=1 Tax=Arundo donax TaxID=35708 RepID=A0A0A9F7G5_ARUDO